MRAEKQLITSEYLNRLKNSPFFILADYRGMKVPHFNELRRRLAKTGAEIHVIKNAMFDRAVREAGLPGLGDALTGQLAAVTGRQDIAAAAKVLKTFRAEFERPAIQFGYLDAQRLEAAELVQLADLPPLEILRAQLLGLLNTPATRLVQVLRAPGQQVARVLQARADKAE
ncbi:MAG TPA: 50S ribosomal protein L10 [Candidatus Paceibacterota bacterium]|nr:50S ribosomal protein L10 [Verrucomicrobiota bacterium]HRZ44201.1 50S ribosomal protein L10 [Candidatus Paceibacterota bacterium]HRZ91928.1 50S ribosomal protein L10 [Candidatus Paceibacterota bacterium]